MTDEQHGEIEDIDTRLTGVDRVVRGACTTLNAACHIDTQPDDWSVLDGRSTTGGLRLWLALASGSMVAQYQHQQADGTTTTYAYVDDWNHGTHLYVRRRVWWRRISRSYYGPAEGRTTPQ